MSAPVGSIINKFFQREGQPLNILCCPTHEKAEQSIAKTGHNFYAIRTDRVKDWNTVYAPLPANYHLLEKNKQDQIPSHLNYDVVFCQNKFGQFQLLQNIAKQLHLPMICLEHTQPIHTWSAGELAAFTNMKGDINVFISETSKNSWGFKDDPSAIVIEHGIDTNLHKSAHTKHNIVLSVMNEYKSRSYFLGGELFDEISRKVPIVLVGNNPGISKAAKDQYELATIYGEAGIFLNTSQVSPIPMSLLEAMASRCLIISTATCQIPDIIKHGQNGLLYNTAEEGVALLRKALASPDDFDNIRQAGYQTIVQRFSLDRFVKDWDFAFRKAAAFTFLG